VCTGMALGARTGRGYCLEPVTTGTLFYLTTHIHSSLRPFGVQAGSATFAAVTVCRAPGSTRLATYNVMQLMLGF
jgi:hypothetical protein